MYSTSVPAVVAGVLKEKLIVENFDQKTEMSLGEVKDFNMKVKWSDKSAVAQVAEQSVHPVAHLLVVCDNESLTWEEFFSAGSEIGDLSSLAHRRMRTIVETFLPSLKFDDSAWRFEVNSPLAASRPTVHTHIILGHKNLFGPTGLIRRCVDSAIRSPANK